MRVRTVGKRCTSPCLRYRLREIRFHPAPAFAPEAAIGRGRDRRTGRAMEANQGMRKPVRQRNEEQRESSAPIASG